jgi:hypothetical protein
MRRPRGTRGDAGRSGGAVGDQAVVIRQSCAPPAGANEFAAGSSQSPPSRTVAASSRRSGGVRSDPRAPPSPTLPRKLRGGGRTARYVDVGSTFIPSPGLPWDVVASSSEARTCLSRFYTVEAPFGDASAAPRRGFSQFQPRALARGGGHAIIGGSQSLIIQYTRQRNLRSGRAGASIAAHGRPPSPRRRTLRCSSGKFIRSWGGRDDASRRRPRSPTPPPPGAPSAPGCCGPRASASAGR